jgi:hypothetical protein
MRSIRSKVSPQLRHAYSYKGMGPIYNTDTTGCVESFFPYPSIIMVLDFFRRKRLSPEGQKRLVVALARAEESIVDAHVDNALDVIEAIGDELPIERVLEVYLEALEANPQRAEIIARRVLSKLGV